MRKKLLLFALLLFAGLSAKAQWISLATDNTGDGQISSNLDGKQLSYYYNDVSDSIFFKIDVAKALDDDIGLHIAMNVEGAGATGTWFGKQNKTFKYNLLLTVFAHKDPANPGQYITLIGVANPAGVNVGDFANVAFNNISTVFSTVDNYYIMAMRRKSIYTGRNLIADVIAAVGPENGWNDDIPNTGSGKISIIPPRNPKLDLYAPIAGAEWQADQDKSITWTADDITYLKLEYNTDTTSNEWKLIADSVLADNGFFIWTVPNEQSEQARVRVSDSDSAEIFRISPVFKITHSVGVQELFSNIDRNSMRVFPVPSNTGMVYLSMGTDNNIALRSRIVITNIAGQQVFNQEMSGQQSLHNYPLDLSDLPNGIYSVQFQNGAYLASSRIVLMK